MLFTIYSLIVAAPDVLHVIFIQIPVFRRRSDSRVNGKTLQIIVRNDEYAATKLLFV